MKKVLLGLFLILGVVSFAAPKYVDKVKLQKNSYQIIQDEADVFLFGKSTEDVGLTVGIYNIQESNDMAKLRQGHQLNKNLYLQEKIIELM